MNPLIPKLEAQVADLTTRQKAALAAAEADGASDDDRAKRLAEFDALDADKKKAQASLDRARRLDREEADAARLKAEAEAAPATKPIVSQTHNPHAPTAGIVIPAAARRHGPLKAFKGADAERNAYQAGLWAAATLYEHRPSLAAYQAQYGDPQAALNTTDNARGGYFVPDVIDTAVLELYELYGVFRRFADVVAMTSDTLLSPRWTGGMTAYWVGEGQAPPPSDPTWDMIQLVAKNLAAMTKMTRQLDEDSVVALGDKVTLAAAQAFALAEDNAGWNGDGTIAFGGIVGLLTKLLDAANAASVVTAAAGHTTPAALTLADFYAVIGKYPNWANANPRWFVHKEVYAATMMPLQLAVYGTTPENVQGGAKPMFLGYPVEFLNVGPKLAGSTTGTIPVVFGDLALSSKLGDRRRSRTMERGLINDDFVRQLFTLFAACRLDIVNHTVTDPKDATRAGPVIGLKLA